MEQHANPHSEQNDRDASGHGKSDRAERGPPQFLDPTLDFALAESDFAFRQSTVASTNVIIFTELQSGSCPPHRDINQWLRALGTPPTNNNNTGFGDFERSALRAAVALPPMRRTSALRSQGAAV